MAQSTHHGCAVSNHPEEGRVPMETLVTSWGKMAYWHVAGTGVPLLFLHGTGCDSTDWATTITSLPVGSPVVSLDFRGHGESDVPQIGFTLEDLADDVVCLADHLRLPHVILVGHSLGGMAAMTVARRSSRVVGLVLLEGWTTLSAAHAFDNGRFYGMLPRPTVERIEIKARETKARFTPRIWDGFWQSVETFSAYTYLERASIPIIEVYGEMGRNRTTEQGLRVPLNPCIDWIWVPNAGHYLPHERPDRVAAACVRGLQRVQQSVSR